VQQDKQINQCACQQKVAAAAKELTDSVMQPKQVILLIRLFTNDQVPRKHEFLQKVDAT